MSAEKTKAGLERMLANGAGRTGAKLDGWSRFTRLARLVLHDWPERRRQRGQLLEMETHRLRDIGIDRAEAVREGQKPFWR